MTLISIIRQLGVHVTETKEVIGYILSANRREWKFIANEYATIHDLCTELQSQTNTPVVSYTNMRIINIKQEILLQHKELLKIIIEIIVVQPRLITQAEKVMEDKTEHITHSVKSNEEKKGEVQLFRIGRKKRTCKLCRTGIGEYKRKKDPLISTYENILCEMCYKGFHWDIKGERKYDYFKYEKKE
ncbi:hypothetical protein NEAUS04_1516 [Nematocida ausubeli]|nr:hypothetical protein NEAUS07_0632 [Nematocida ausubeli]KAI5146969.1 hypothetical protein NEAUS05_0305 [Nematocida ausubeli]KAI5163381.1 hypothetical protein NEAUS04_1516 [Nematocida ausubeli]